MKRIPVPVWAVALALVPPLLASLLGSFQGNQFAQLTMFALATAALALSWGYAGILNLGHAVSFGVGAYVAGFVAIHAGSWGVLLGLVLGPLTAMALSLLVAAVALRGRVDIVTFALTTFVVLFAAVQLAQQWTPVTGGYSGLGGIPGIGVGAWQADALTQRIIVTSVAGIGLVLIVLVARSPFGALLRMIRDNPVRAGALGYDVPAIRVTVFTATGGIVGLAGAFYATQAQFVSPDQIGILLSTNFLVWAMIGSRTSIIGSFIAALVMGFVTNELSHLIAGYWELLIGVLFVLVVLFLPTGVTDTVGRMLPARLRRPPRVQVDRSDEPMREAKSEQFSCRGISVAFGPFRAISDVSIAFLPAGVHSLIGPNGAGKSTLIDALSGIRRPQLGQWSVGDTDLSMLRPWQLARRGVARTFQTPSVGVDLTVAQNLALAHWGTRKRAISLLVQPWSFQLADESWRVIEGGALSERLDDQAGLLSHGQLQVLELAMALSGDARVVLLDEPTAGMTRVETDRMAALIRSYAENSGTTVVIVEHDMDLIRAIAGRVTVLQAGALLAEGTVGEIEANAAVTAAYVGEGAL